jgi:hypothetical protein
MVEEARESTSLKIKPSIHKKAKMYAVEHDMQLSSVLEEAVDDWLKKQRSRKQ